MIYHSRGGYGESLKAISHKKFHRAPQWSNIWGLLHKIYGSLHLIL